MTGLHPAISGFLLTLVEDPPQTTAELDEWMDNFKGVLRSVYLPSWKKDVPVEVSNDHP